MRRNQQAQSHQTGSGTELGDALTSLGLILSLILEFKEAQRFNRNLKLFLISYFSFSRLHSSVV